jgi:hypothetical protein
MKAPLTTPEQTAHSLENTNLKRVPASKETTRGPKPKKEDHNFSQSCDIREDRGVRQIKTTIRKESPRGGK